LGNPFFSRSEYKTFPLDVNLFKPIITELDSNNKVAFVDGGNMEILGAPNFSVQLNRVYFNIFNGKIRLNPKNLPSCIEFFSVTTSFFDGKEINYKTHIFPVKEEFYKFLPKESDLSFSSCDRTIMVGNMRADISRVASIARRFAEWEYAKWIVHYELDSGDFIVMDGTLQTAFTNESKYSSHAYKEAEKVEVTFTGLSKTNHLFTDTGLSLLGAIRKLSEDLKVPYEMWYYPVASVLSPDHEALIYVVKLNPAAQRIFRYEIYKPQAEKLIKEELGKLFSQLAKNSRDISFPGYPYGLIEADHRARVKVREVERYRLKLLSEISKVKRRWEKFARHIMALDAHDLIDILMR